MKKLFLLCVLILSTLVLSRAQNNWVDCVYLQNGSIIKGTIIEQVVGQNLKIQTTDGSVFVFEMKDVIKITKEQQAAPVQQFAAPLPGQGYMAPGYAQQGMYGAVGGRLKYEWDWRDKELKLKAGDSFISRMQASAILLPDEYSRYTEAAGIYKSGESWLDAGGWGWGFFLGSTIWFAVEAGLENEEMMMVEGICMGIGFYWGLICDIVGWSKRSSARTQLDALVNGYNTRTFGYAFDPSRFRINPSLIASRGTVAPGLSIKYSF